MPTLPVEELLKKIAELFQAHAVPAEEARIVAEHLVEAEASGVVSHGLIRVPQYLQALREGRIKPGVELRVRSTTAATAALDGQHGFGLVMARRAMDFAVDLARRAGAGVVTLGNCDHTGRLGSYTERAARRGVAAMMMVNAGGNGQWVAPFGGIAGRLGTNPLSIAVPSDSSDPVVLDIATAVAPEGKVRAAMAADRTIPQGWVVNHRGEATTNPADLYGPPRGALLSFGGHKGFGLGLLIDALAGGLSGAGCCHDPNAPMAGETDGVFLLAVDIAAFRPPEQFLAEVRRLVAHVRTSPTALGAVEVFAPGEMEARTRRRCMREGISIEPSIWRAIENIPRSMP